MPGNHSGFADLDPGTPATVDPPDLDEADASATGGTLAAGTYEYAVTDQFNGADSTERRPVPGLRDRRPAGRHRPHRRHRPTGSVSLVWQAICHAANYIIYRAPVVSGVRRQLDRDRHLRHAPLGHPARQQLGRHRPTSPASTQTVCQGPTTDPTSCGGEQELTFTDTGST